VRTIALYAFREPIQLLSCTCEAALSSVQVGIELLEKALHGRH
jgi:hypothetical protein